jgi:hypothetical protein
MVTFPSSVLKAELSDRAAALAELDRLTAEGTACWELVLLMGDPQTVATGRTWHRRVGLVEQFARTEQAAVMDYRPLRRHRH